MADLEGRVAALEKSLRQESERRERVEGRLRGVRTIVDALGVALCSATPNMLDLIIHNLSSCEADARTVNAHDETIRELREMREYFERRKASAARVRPKDGGAPPQS